MKQGLTKIVLVEPIGPINLGSIARLCENFGINELRLVSPRCDPNNPEARKMALKGKYLLENAKIYTSLLDAIADCPLVIATCGRIDHGDIPLHKAEEALGWINSHPKSTPTAIIFGREDRGLTNQELLLANKVISVETGSSYPSLNLSHAVAIVLYELLKVNCSKKKPEETEQFIPALPKELDNFLEDSKKLLLEIGFLLNHTSQSRMNKLRSFLHRAEIRSQEVSLMRGILRQVRWAIHHNKKN
tara:strand:+ start:1683 stop:2420 length:738 start_codon:yes stop_codon:yes gene_type:complete